MKIKELIEKLQKIENKEREIYMASDAEGNHYYKLRSFGICHEGIVLYPKDTYLAYEEVYKVTSKLTSEEITQRMLEFQDLLTSDPNFNYSIQEFADWLKNEKFN